MPWFPFLSAVSNPTDALAMLKEMASVGIPMTLALVAAWLVMVVVYEHAIAAKKAARVAAR